MSVTIAASLTSSDSAIVVGILVAWAVSVVMVRRAPQLGAMVTSALGVGASVYLIQQKFSDESICSGDQTSLFDCDAVNQSAYSSLGPIPVGPQSFGPISLGPIPLGPKSLGSISLGRSHVFDWVRRRGWVVFEGYPRRQARVHP